jgi:TolB-like protein
MKLNKIVLFPLVIVAAIISPIMSIAQSDYEKQTATFSVDLAKKIKEANKIKVAVSDFLDNDGNITELGKAIAEDISVGIVNEGKGTFQVMERSNLNAILKEQKLASTGLIDPETVKQLGKLKMVDAVIVGNITPFGNSFRVTIKILDTETGMSIAASAGNLSGTDDIKELFNKKITIFNPTTQTANPETIKKSTSPDKTAADVIFEVGVSDMRKSECEVPYRQITTTMQYYGQVCFENQTDFDLVLTSTYHNSLYSDLKVLIPKGGRNCWPRELVNRNGPDETVREFNFTFTTINNSIKKKGTYQITLEKCKVKSVVLTKNNLYLE